ncbi:MAG TPA: MerR family transcriptional regulator [Candidatus Egerieisoma faecipullorum]|uniref:MerR family transcriptional regulator n=1 Tax=Candidatus Egerieisoma faecipullorum TaxID=2840963 RepID=A0A9D1I8G5_9CLOT|nr:MerR family transcriptional regulator [Candidatus Egerieisoma faecipullorum]
MYKIGELSRLCHLPVKTLRYYDSEGLLVPDEIDKFTGYRYYSAARIADCNRIIALKELGFSLNEIKQHLQADSSDDLLALIDAKRTELEKALSRIEFQLKQLAYIRNVITEGENSMFDLVIRNSDVIRVAYTRSIFHTKTDACIAAQSIKSALPNNVIGQQIVIINYETEYHEQDFDLGVCVEIREKLPQGSTYCEKTISFLDETASIVCNKNQLKEAYDFMVRQLDEQACQIVGAFYEIYYDDKTVELKVPIRRLSKKSTFVNDNPVLAFENDTKALGKWEFIDKIPSIEQFYLKKPKYSDSNNFWLKELYFLPGGQGYWIVDGWTKGRIMMSFGYPKYTCCNSYSIHHQNGKTLMFVEMKDDFYSISRGGKPEIYVFEKILDKEYSKEEIRIYDNTDIPFTPDAFVIGTWIVTDFVDSPDCFAKNKQNFPQEALFFESVTFHDNGKAIVQCKERSAFTVKWTNGYLLDQKNAIAESYVTRKIDGTEYLFVEWKSGDYLFGGRNPQWYVFMRNLS